MNQLQVQVVGTLVTVVGLVVVAPYATGTVLAQLTVGFVAYPVRWMRSWRRRPTRTVQKDSIASGVTISDKVVAELVEGAKPDDGLQALRSNVAALSDQLASERRRVDRALRDLDDALTGTAGGIRADLGKHMAAEHMERSEQRRLELRALPLAAAGAVVAGCSFWFDESALGAGVVASAALLALYCIAWSAHRIGRGVVTASRALLALDDRLES